MADQQANGEISEEEFLRYWRRFKLFKRGIMFDYSDLKRKFCVKADPKSIKYWIEPNTGGMAPVGTYVIKWNDGTREQVTSCNPTFSKENFKTGHWYWVEDPKGKQYSCNECIVQNERIVLTAQGGLDA